MALTNENAALGIVRLTLSMPDAPQCLNDVSQVHRHIVSNDKELRDNSAGSPDSEQHLLSELKSAETNSAAVKHNDAEAQFRLGVASVRLGESSTAAKWLGLSAKQGYAEAQFLLGVDALSNGCWSDAAAWLRHAAEQGHEDSLHLLRDNAESGNVHSQWFLGEMYLVGLGVEPAAAKGVLWILCAAEQGHVAALSLLGSAIERGFDWASQLRQLVRQIENRNDGEAHKRSRPQWRARVRKALATGFSLATKSGIEFDFSMSRERQAAFAGGLRSAGGNEFDSRRSRELAERGDAESQYLQGVSSLQRGDGSFAATCMWRAAKQDHPEAQYVVGSHLFYCGSWSDAIDWLQRAAVQGHKDALNLLRESAEARNAQSQWILGVMYFIGLGVDLDEAEGVLWALCAAKQGDVNASKLLSVAVEVGWEAPQLKQLLRQYANGGDRELRWRLGRVHLDGEVVDRDAPEALNWFSLAANSGRGATLNDLRRMAEGGEAEAQWRLGRLYLDGFLVQRDTRETANWFGLAAGSGHAAALDDLGRMAEGGEAEATVRLGRLYLDGFLMQHDHGQALDLLRRTAEGGEPEAQWRLGRMHLDGVVVRRDTGEAANWFGLAVGGGHTPALDDLRRMAEGWDAEAQWRLGQIYLDGVAVQRDAREAAELFSLAARSGHAVALLDLRRMAEGGEAEATVRLGRLYLDGLVSGEDSSTLTAWIEGAADTEDATVWMLVLRRMAEGGEVETQWHLGRIHLDGVVVDRNAREAMNWFSLAVGRGHAQSLDDLRRMAEGGEVETQWRLGRVRFDGDVAERDARQASDRFSLAAGLGHTGALDDLHRMAKDGEAEAQVRLGRLHLDGIGSNEDTSILLAWIKGAADTGDAKAWKLIFRACEVGNAEALSFLVERMKYREQPGVRLLYEEVDRGNAWAESIRDALGLPKDVRQIYD